MPGVYLGEPYAADRPGTQVFLAPGPDGLALLPEVSPYTYGPMVRVPARWWHRIVLAVQTVDPVAAHLLDQWSGSADPDYAGEFTPTAGQLAIVEHALRAALPLLVPGAEPPDDGLPTAWDYQRMVEAVQAALEASLTGEEPVTAWFE